MVPAALILGTLGDASSPGLGALGWCQQLHDFPRTAHFQAEPGPVPAAPSTLSRWADGDVELGAGPSGAAQACADISQGFPAAGPTLGTVRSQQGRARAAGGMAKHSGTLSWCFLPCSPALPRMTRAAVCKASKGWFRCECLSWAVQLTPSQAAEEQLQESSEPWQG